MKERVTACLLLLDPRDRILLMQVDGGEVSGPGAYRSAKWITLRGRVEAGETVYEAAAREAREETGQSDIEIGPIVWYGEHVLTIRGIPHLLKESFFAARAERPELSDAFWTDEERRVVKAIRWWSLADLRETAEIILPRVLPALLPDVLDSRYGDAPLRIEL